MSGYYDRFAGRKYKAAKPVEVENRFSYYIIRSDEHQVPDNEAAEVCKFLKSVKLDDCTYTYVILEHPATWKEAKDVFGPIGNLFPWRGAGTAFERVVVMDANDPSDVRAFEEFNFKASCRALLDRAGETRLDSKKLTKLDPQAHGGAGKKTATVRDDPL